MQIRIERFGALLLALMLSACATPTPTHVALATPAQGSIASTEVVAPIAQSEIYIYVPPTTAGQGQGLIGALIDAGVDSYRAGTAETGVKPLRDAIVDMSFDHDLASQLKDSLSQIAWLHLDGVRVIKEVAGKKIDGAITGSKDGAVLIAIADYHLSNDGRQLFITVNVDLYPNSAALAAFKPAKGRPDVPSDPSNSLYRNTFTYESDLPGPPVKREINMPAWAADNGAAFRAAMKLGVAKLGEMIAMDLQGGPPGAATAPAGAGPVVQGPDGVLAREADGSLTFTTTPRPS
jgi:hypothetical protein